MTFPAGGVLCTNCCSRIHIQNGTTGWFANTYSVIPEAHTLALREFRPFYSIKKLVTILRKFWQLWFSNLQLPFVEHSTEYSDFLCSNIINPWKMQTKLSALIHFWLNNILPQHNGGCCNILPAVCKSFIWMKIWSMSSHSKNSKLIFC